ncbi:MAG: class I SAM-dependent methyltransferase [Cyanobacteria bacterium RU_5_0]|nr:class I SAM-dependent methyltransferase [Cyanobacteria bacterium RU_5_0]
MDESVSKITEIDRIRQQFDYGPYPRIALEESPKEKYGVLFYHNFITPYYLKHRKVIDTNGVLILDAGCGTGYKALLLAEANPGARIVGIDISEQSIERSRQRLAHHGFDNVEFHVLSIGEIATLGLEFDYINCDEVLYLLPDPAAGLQAFKSVLKPHGLIRANLHSLYQRINYYRAQELFKFIGLFDNNPQEFEEEAVIATMNALKDNVKLKMQTWRSSEKKTPEAMKEFLAMNLLFVGDTGYTIPDLFQMVEQADLEFLTMVNWRHWDVTDLFKDEDDLPSLWAIGLAEASSQDKVRLYELLNPVHRLLDFWCAHPGNAGIPVDDWSEANWQQAIVHLHPQLRNDNVREELAQSIQTGAAFEISRHITLPAQAPVLLEPSQAACLLPLWDGAQPIQAIVDRYRKIRPVDPFTLEPLTDAQAFETVKDLLNRMDAFLYVLLERSETGNRA